MCTPENQTSTWFDEYQKGVRYGLEGQILVDEKSKYQRITIIDSKRYGKALLLDNCWMTAEQQEKHYHECLVHPALSGALEIKRGLIVGGGDGGTAKECLRYKEVEHLDLVEIDERVIKLSQKYLPTIGGNAWQDPRLQINIEDGIKWTKHAGNEVYDFVIIDSSDPNGPAKGLFNETFIRDCKRILRPGGIFAIQSESPESFLKIHLDIIRLVKKIFQFADPIYGWVPMYPSGWWSWTFASMGKPHYLHPHSKRVNAISQDCIIWSSKWQKGAFQAIPAFIERALK